MRNAIEERIKTDVQSGKDERTIRSFVQSQRLESDIEQFFLDMIDDEIAIQKLREVRTADATLLIYLGYILMALAIFFGTYHIGMGGAILIIGLLIKRRGDAKARAAAEISSIAELLPEEPTKFHKRRI